MHCKQIISLEGDAVAKYINAQYYRWWATAAMYASKAYNDTQLLDNAVSTWNSVSQL